MGNKVAGGTICPEIEPRPKTKATNSIAILACG